MPVVALMTSPNNEQRTAARRAGARECLLADEFDFQIWTRTFEFCRREMTLSRELADRYGVVIAGDDQGRHAQLANAPSNTQARASAQARNVAHKQHGSVVGLVEEAHIFACPVSVNVTNNRELQSTSFVCFEPEFRIGVSNQKPLGTTITTTFDIMSICSNHFRQYPDAGPDIGGIV